MSDLAGAERDALRESVRTYLARAVAPVADEWEAAGAIPDDALRLAADHGFVAPGVPELHGGSGADDPHWVAAVVEEMMLAGLASLALVLLAHGDVPVRALSVSTEEPAAGWLAGLASAELLATTALEADLTLERGLLRGRAPMVIGAGSAGLFVVAARDGEHRRVVVVERRARGVHVEPVRAPVGLRATGLAHLQFDGAACVVLDEVSLQDLQGGARVLLARAAVAAGRHALRTTAEYVAERRAFDTPIAAFANTRQRLGGAAALWRGADALSAEALHAWSDGRLDPVAAAAAKLLATDALARIVDDGVQLHGGYGYMLEYPIARAYADAGFLPLHGGRSEDLRSVVAADLLTHLHP